MGSFSFKFSGQQNVIFMFFKPFIWILSVPVRNTKKKRRKMSAICFTETKIYIEKMCLFKNINWGPTCFGLYWGPLLGQSLTQSLPSSSLQSGWEKAASSRHEVCSGTHRQGNCLAEQRFPAKHLKTGKVGWVSGEVWIPLNIHVIQRKKEDKCFSKISKEIE